MNKAIERLEAIEADIKTSETLIGIEEENFNAAVDDAARELAQANID